VTHTSFNLGELRRAIKPVRLHWFPRLRSTNDHAAVMRKRGELFAPAMVLTGHQMAGRGRGSNSWWSSGGVLTVTFVFAVDEQLAAHQLPLIAGLAVRNAVSGLVPGARVQLKWPNDLYAGGRKAAGLLCERIHKADLIGLGLNVNVEEREIPKELRNGVTSLSMLVGRPLDMTQVLTAVTRGLHAMISHHGDRSFAQMLREYDEHHALVGRRVSVSASAGELPICGKCEGLDGMGRLLLRSGRTLHRVIAGQVQML
jgi:BirA family biotin operon repressor/biotin-[acetyl-CoA-carboxylase] ligase